MILPHTVVHPGQRGKPVFFIADNTVFVQCLPSAFKLRLHKSDVQSARTHNLRHLRQNERL